MIFKQAATAGTMDSCDISIRIEKSETPDNKIFLTSVVERQYGTHIRKLLDDMLKAYDMTGVVVNAVDRGALDCTIEARMACVIHRCSESVEVIDSEL